MKEYLLLIRTEGDYCEAMEPEQYREHIKKVSAYIQQLTQQGHLKAAQPLSMTGEMVKGKKSNFKDGPFVETKEVIIGYYHILARDLEEAKAIAKANPVMEDTETARIEVREIKTREE